MHLIFRLFFVLLIALFSIKAEAALDSRTRCVTVSVAPYKFFVEAIAGNTLQINLLVPAGTSFHDYEPTPKQVIQASNADIWFRIGESFEARGIKAMQNQNPRLRIVDLRDDVNLITLASEGGCPHCAKNGADLHIWLSPKEVKKQAILIEDVLEEVYPENREVYRSNLSTLIHRLDRLDQEITRKLAQLTDRTFMVGHPAYAYFARDYNLKQLPIEFEGKDPSPRQLHNLLNQARQMHIHTIFVQKEYGNKGPNLIAKELGAKVVILDPYPSDYFTALNEIANRISEKDNP